MVLYNTMAYKASFDVPYRKLRQSQNNRHATLGQPVKHTYGMRIRAKYTIISHASERLLWILSSTRSFSSDPDSLHSNSLSSGSWATLNDLDTYRIVYAQQSILLWKQAWCAINISKRGLLWNRNLQSDIVHLIPYRLLTSKDSMSSKFSVTSAIGTSAVSIYKQGIWKIEWRICNAVHSQKQFAPPHPTCASTCASWEVARVDLLSQFFITCWLQNIAVPNIIKPT